MLVNVVNRILGNRSALSVPLLLMGPAREQYLVWRGHYI